MRPPAQRPDTASLRTELGGSKTDRNRHITAWVKSKLAGRRDDEFVFVVHGTTADPRRTQKSIA